jgi:hypothetical protein
MGQLNGQDDDNDHPCVWRSFFVIGARHEATPRWRLRAAGGPWMRSGVGGCPPGTLPGSNARARLCATPCAGPLAMLAAMRWASPGPLTCSAAMSPAHRQHRQAPGAVAANLAFKPKAITATLAA